MYNWITDHWIIVVLHNKRGRDKFLPNFNRQSKMTSCGAIPNERIHILNSPTNTNIWVLKMWFCHNFLKITFFLNLKFLTSQNKTHHMSLTQGWTDANSMSVCDITTTSSNQCVCSWEVHRQVTMNCIPTSHTPQNNIKLVLQQSNLGRAAKTLKFYPVISPVHLHKLWEIFSFPSLEGSVIRSRMGSGPLAL